MRNNLIAISLIFISSICFAQNKSINFEKSSFAEIKSKAKIENKLIFIDAFTVWCGPCKWLAKNVFTNDTVADYFNLKFINAQIDMEKGEGIDIAKLYNIRCYPNLLFIDGDGNIIHRGAGSMSVKKFMQFAEDAQNPETRFSKYLNEYESKKNDTVFLIKYISIISRTCLPFDNIVNDYFKLQNEDELSNRTNWNVIRDYITDYKSKEFSYLINNIDKFQKAYTVDSVNNKIKEVFIKNGYKIITNRNAKAEDYEAYKNEIIKMNFASKDEILFTLDMAYYSLKLEWKKYCDLAVENVDKYYKTIDEFNNVSWNIYEHSDDVKVLQKAASWMQKAIEINKDNPKWFTFDTYAALLFKLNKKTEAKEFALKAIEIAKASEIGEDEYKSTLELLDKIEKLK